MLPYLSTTVEVPLVGHLKDGELAVVLTWTPGKKVDGNRMVVEELDLKTEFQPSETIKCDVGFGMRQCNGVRLTADKILDGDRFATIQAMKFDRIGDFNYMVYTRRYLRNATASALDRDMSLMATLQVYAPLHSGPVYEMNLPFYTPDIEEKYWVGFCLRGGQGINFNGFSIADPNALFLNKPNVNKDCHLNKATIPTVAVSVPQNPEATINKDNSMAELTWEENLKPDEVPISKYRVFLSEKDSTGMPTILTTLGAKTSYKLHFTRSMWGKDFVFSVQAINKNGKMSVQSDQGVFTVINPTVEPQHQQPASKNTSAPSTQHATAPEEQQHQTGPTVHTSVANHTAAASEQHQSHAAEPKKAVPPPALMKPMTSLSMVNVNATKIDLRWN